MATTSATVTNIGQTLGTLALSTSAGTYVLTPAFNSGVPETVMFISDAAWLVATDGGTNYCLVPANCGVLIPVKIGTVHAKTVSGTATLYAMVAA